MLPRIVYAGKPAALVKICPLCFLFRTAVAKTIHLFERNSVPKSIQAQNLKIVTTHFNIIPFPTAQDNFSHIFGFLCSILKFGFSDYLWPLRKSWDLWQFLQDKKSSIISGESNPSPLSSFQLLPLFL